jgi:AraC-like DNA-binding protein
VSAVVYTEAAAAPSLAGVVRCYWSIEGFVPPGESVVNRVLPDGCMDVIFNLGDAPTGEIGTLPEPGYVVGTMPEAMIVGMSGRVDMIGVRFEPGAAVAYLGVPAPELTARSVGFSDVRREARDVTEQVAIAGDTAARGFASGGQPAGAARVARARLRERAGVLDRALASARMLAPDPLVASAVGLIESSRGAIAVSEIEGRLGVSPRTLTRRFTAAVGLTPKMACRVARLQSAASAIRADPSASLARIAVKAGFADQPHLNRDFASLARVTPAGYARESTAGLVRDEPEDAD